MFKPRTVRANPGRLVTLHVPDSNRTKSSSFNYKIIDSIMYTYILANELLINFSMDEHYCLVKSKNFTTSEVTKQVATYGNRIKSFLT
jgi:rRNA maturation protein Rpf1